ncbi:MAG: histidine phosphatase family protein [Chloroflexota bacterium]|nr:histidine phosphatase family protein [Chloroflexota bacterium]
MPATILLIRHGETAWNREKIFRGVYDIPLNENGRAQARQVAQALAGREIDAAYSSPLSRAMETAQIALKSHGVEVESHPGLIDFNYGAWTGLADSVVAEKWPQAHALWGSAPHRATPPSGDSLPHVFQRTFGTLAELVQKHPDQTIAIFAHRVVNKLLILGMLTLGLERFPFIRQDNCCLNEFQYTGSDYIVIALNDVNHIKRSGAALLEEDF